VNGTIKSSSDLLISNNSANTAPITLNNNAGSVFQVLQSGTTGGWLYNCVAGDTSIRSFGKLLLAAGSTSGTGTLTASIILGNSNYCVGIGSNVNPAYTLDVGGTINTSGGLRVSPSATTTTSTNSFLLDNPLYIRSDTNHGLIYGNNLTAKSVGVDGPFLFGYAGGALGTTGGTGTKGVLYWNVNSQVGINTTTPATTLDVNGGVTIRNGFRPLYNYFTGSGPITPAITSYGTNYYIINSAVTGITIPAPIIVADTNAYWVFRNATGSYLSITVTWPTQYYPTVGGTLTTFSPAVSPTTSFIPIPPQNAITIMFAWTSGGNQGSYCFAGPGTGVSSNIYAVF
jgi:hypothetical protein